VKITTFASEKLGRAVLATLAALLPTAALAQVPARPGGAPTATQPGAGTRPAALGATEALRGRTIEEVRIVGNRTLSAAVIRNVIRTREGDKFDPTTVDEDYQRVYALRKFSNVEPKVEPTATGVIVVFQVSEQPR